jgi:hypothetical protein
MSQSRRILLHEANQARDAGAIGIVPQGVALGYFVTAPFGARTKTFRLQNLRFELVWSAR